MQKSIILLVALFVSVSCDLQAQISDGKPHAYRSTLDTCKNEPLSIFVFNGEKIYSGPKYFQTGKRLFIDDGIRIEFLSVWGFSHKDDNDNNLYLLESDSTKYLMVPQYPTIIVESGDTLRHLNASALKDGRLEWGNAYVDNGLSPIVFYQSCQHCQGSGMCYTCSGMGKINTLSKTIACPMCNKDGKCPFCMGRGKELVVRSVKRARGLSLPSDK